MRVHPPFGHVPTSETTNTTCWDALATWLLSAMLRIWLSASPLNSTSLLNVPVYSIGPPGEANEGREVIDSAVVHGAVENVLSAWFVVGTCLTSNRMVTVDDISLMLHTVIPRWGLSTNTPSPDGGSVSSENLTLVANTLPPERENGPGPDEGADPGS